MIPQGAVCDILPPNQGNRAPRRMKRSRIDKAVKARPDVASFGTVWRGVARSGGHGMETDPGLHTTASDHVRSPSGSSRNVTRPVPAVTVNLIAATGLSTSPTASPAPTPIRSRRIKL